MLKNTKQPQYFKSFLLGMTAIVLPAFSFNQNIPKVKADTVPDWKKVKSDYKKSTIALGLIGLFTGNNQNKNKDKE